MRLSEIGDEGQRRLKASSVLVVGAGGLGAPVLSYLAAAGVGHITVVDDDHVEPSNFHRQVLFTEEDLGEPKAERAASRLRSLNPDIQVTAHVERLTAENAETLIAPVDIVADGTDTFATRYVVNDACVLTGTPNAYASISQFEGQASLFSTPGGPCYRCLFPNPPPPGLVPSCAEGGVLGVLPGLLGSVQAAEVIKHLLGIGTSLAGRLLVWNVLTMQSRTVQVPHNPDCLVCGAHPSITSVTAATECPAPACSSVEVPEIPPHELSQRLARENPPLVLDVRTREEAKTASMGGLLIPLNELPNRFKELTKYRRAPIVVYCQRGMRSMQAVRLLHDEGFDQAVSLQGGIEAWNEHVRNVQSPLPAAPPQ